MTFFLKGERAAWKVSDPGHTLLEKRKKLSYSPFSVTRLNSWKMFASFIHALYVRELRVSKESRSY